MEDGVPGTPPQGPVRPVPGPLSSPLSDSAQCSPLTPLRAMGSPTAEDTSSSYPASPTRAAMERAKSLPRTPEQWHESCQWVPLPQPQPQGMVSVSVENLSVCFGQMQANIWELHRQLSCVIAEQQSHQRRFGELVLRQASDVLTRQQAFGGAVQRARSAPPEEHGVQGASRQVRADGPPAAPAPLKPIEQDSGQRGSADEHAVVPALERRISRLEEQFAEMVKGTQEQWERLEAVALRSEQVVARTLLEEPLDLSGHSEIAAIKNNFPTESAKPATPPGAKSALPGESSQMMASQLDSVQGLKRRKGKAGTAKQAAGVVQRVPKGSVADELPKQSGAGRPAEDCRTFLQRLVAKKRHAFGDNVLEFLVCCFVIVSIVSVLTWRTVHTWRGRAQPDSLLEHRHASFTTTEAVVRALPPLPAQPVTQPRPAHRRKHGRWAKLLRPSRPPPMVTSPTTESTTSLDVHLSSSSSARPASHTEGSSPPSTTSVTLAASVVTPATTRPPAPRIPSTIAEFLTRVGLPGVMSRDGMRRSVLHLAVSEGLWQVTNELLASTTFTAVDSQDMHGDTALHLAAHHGHLRIAQAILRSGRFTQAGARNNAGRTALHLAVSSPVSEAHNDVSHLLLDYYATVPDTPDAKGRTALHLAALNGHQRLAVALVASSHFTAENAKDVRGMTALHCAALKGHVPVTEALIWRRPASPGRGRLGSALDLEALDDKKRTAFDIAVARNYVGVAEVIQRSLPALRPGPVVPPVRGIPSLKATVRTEITPNLARRIDGTS